MERCEHFVRYFGLNRDEIEGRDADGATGAHTLRGNVEELPVEIEALLGAEEVASQDVGNEQALADLERVHLRDGEIHERAGGAHDEGGDAGEAGGDGVGERVAV